MGKSSETFYRKVALTQGPQESCALLSSVLSSTRKRNKVEAERRGTTAPPVRIDEADFLESLRGVSLT